MTADGARVQHDGSQAAGEAAGGLTADLGRLFRMEEEAGLCLLDAAGRVLQTNATLNGLAGATPAPGSTPEALFEAESHGPLRAAIGAALGGPPAPPSFEARLANPALPADAAVEVFCRPLRGEPGALLRIRDITERRRLAARLQEGERLQEIGRLAGGVAHDFNNLLAAITGCAEAALARAADPASAEDLRQILDSAGRGARLVRQLLAFASRQTLQPRLIALDAALTAFLPLLRRLLGRRVRLETALAAAGAVIHVDPGQLDQVILNLAVNGRDAMPQGGRLRLATTLRVLAAAEPAQGAMVPPGRWAVVELADEGPGMAPETLARIFEPFFTTKRELGGTGLGLSTVLGILRQSGGHVSVASRAGEGTVFRLWFPCQDGAPTPEPAPPPAPPAPAGTRRILLVEDEAPIRRLAARILTEAGFEVTALEDAEAALEHLADGAEAPDLLISDVSMPGMDGVALAQALRARFPGLPVLLISGYAEAMLGADRMREGMRHLQKPFRMAELRDAVAGLL